MIPSIDVASLSAQVQRTVSPTAPEKLQEVAARGVLPGLKPGEILTALVLLAASERTTVRETAQSTLAALPDQLLTGALGSELPAAVVDVLARLYAERVDIVEKLLGMPDIAIDTVEELANSPIDAVTELIATNENRLLKNPTIIERLYMNKQVRMSTADRVLELAVRNGVALPGIPAFAEASVAIQEELIAEPSAEPTPDDLMFAETQTVAAEFEALGEDDAFGTADDGKEEVKAKFLPLHARVGNMTISQKIRAAMLGSKEERMILVRDNNKLVSGAAMRSPLMQEPDAESVSKNKNVSEEVLRILALNPNWSKSYTIKKNLVENPKTPPIISHRLIPHMRESDLRLIAKSKAVPGAIAEAARRHLDKKKK